MGSIRVSGWAICISIVSMLLIAVPSPSALADAPSSDWPMFMRTPDNIGLSFGIGTFSDPQVQWEIDLSEVYPGSESFTFDHIPIDINGDGSLDLLTTGSYATSDDSGVLFLIGVNGTDGTILWRKQFDDSRWGWANPVIGDVDGDGHREIIIGSGRYLHSISLSNGTVEWSHDLSYKSIDHSASVLIWNHSGQRYDIIYANPFGNVSRIDGRNGITDKVVILRDILHDNMGVDSPLLVYSIDNDGDPYIFVTIDEPYSGDICVLDPDLNVVWLEEYDYFHPTGVMAIDGSDPDAPRIVFNSWEYYRNEDNLVVLNASDGEVVWERDLGYSGIANRRNRVIVGDINGDNEPEYILLNSPGGTLYVFNRNGTKLWERDVSGRDIGTICDIDSDGENELLITSEIGEVVCLSGPSGEVEWSKYLHDKLDPALMASDIDGDTKIEIISGSQTGILICLKGNIDENFAPRLIVDTPLNSSYFDGPIKVSGQVVDLDNDDDELTIEMRVDDNGWETLGTGRDFEFKIRIDETSAPKRVLHIRASDGTATSNIVVRELIQEVEVSTPPSSLFYLILILMIVLVVLVLLLMYSRYSRSSSG